MNRMSILQKLMGKNRELIDSLEEIYLVTISAKGPKHLSTIKSLLNYAIALLIYNPDKLNKVLEFLSSEQPLPDYLTFFDAINDVRTRRLFKEGLSKLQALPSGTAD